MPNSAETSDVPVQGNAETNDYRKGYESLAAFAQGKTLDEARHCLAQRQASIAPQPFNDGGTAAVKDYIARLEASQFDGDPNA